MINDYTLPWHWIPAMCITLHTFTDTTSLRPKKLTYLCVCVYERIFIIELFYIIVLG